MVYYIVLLLTLVVLSGTRILNKISSVYRIIEEEDNDEYEN